MQESSRSSTDDAGTSADRSWFWKRLLYRWFVEYNPAYLLSAACVFGGCFLWSRGVVHDGTLTSLLGIPFVAELYAFALVGGAALLTRVGQRRPAVILALVFTVYQWDTTLHVEACAHLGKIGALASLAWFAIFAAKIRAIAWALRIRIARRMIVALTLGAVGLVMIPRALDAFPSGLPLYDERGAGSLLAAWMFALVSLYHGGEISCVDEQDEWGRTVLRRATNAVWAISAAMIALHVAMWCTFARVSFAPILFAAPLLLVRKIRGELRMWSVVGGTLLLASVVDPGAVFATSIIAAGALALRIFAPTFSPVITVRAAAPERIRVPYRAGDGAVFEPRFTYESVPAAPLDAGEIVRAWAGFLFATYLAAWSARWWYGPFPHHVLAIDVAYTIVSAFAMWRLRARIPFGVPLAITYADFVIRGALVPMPQSSAGWGAFVIVLGFALLAVSLLVSYRLRGFQPASSRAAAPP